MIGYIRDATMLFLASLHSSVDRAVGFYPIGRGFESFWGRFSTPVLNWCFTSSGGGFPYPTTPANTAGYSPKQCRMSWKCRAVFVPSAASPLFSGNCFYEFTNVANYGIMRLDGKGTKKIPNRPRNSERKSENDHQHLHPRLERTDPHLRH